MSRRQAVGRASSGRGRTGRQANLTGESASDKPDASRQRRSTPGGINAATTDSSACNKQPTPQFSTAGANYQGKKIEHDNLHQPVDGSSSKSHEEAHDNRKKDSALEPESLDHNLIYQPRHSSSSRRPGNVTREPEHRTIQQQHRSSGRLSRLLLRTNTLLGRRLTYVSKVKSVRRSNSRLSHFGSLCFQ